METNPDTWNKGIWFSHSTPNFSMCVWLTMHNRLSTGERMMARNVGANPSCRLCHDPLESREHLFFTCPYTSTLWSSLTKGLLRLEYSSQWSRVIELISDSRQPTTRLFLIRYVFQTAVYGIWQERNA